jgi:hypothetical protein
VTPISRKMHRSVSLAMAGAQSYSPLHNIQTGSGANSASHPMGNEGCYPGGIVAVV